MVRSNLWLEVTNYLITNMADHEDVSSLAKRMIIRFVYTIVVNTKQGTKQSMNQKEVLRKKPSKRLKDTNWY